MKVIKDTVPKRDYLIVLPFLGALSNKIQRRMKKVFQETVPYGKVHIVFKSTFRFSHLLRFKDQVPSDLKSHVIYHFKCPDCNAGYIGETRVHYKVRCSQHLGISEFTGKPINSGVPTSVTKHIREKKCKCNLKNFEIISQEENYHKRLIKESLFIKFYDYELNGQKTSTDLLLF